MIIGSSLSPTKLVKCMVYYSTLDRGENLIDTTKEIEYMAYITSVP